MSEPDSSFAIEWSRHTPAAFRELGNSDARALRAWLEALPRPELALFVWSSAANDAADWRKARETVRDTVSADVRKFFGGDDLSSSPIRWARLMAKSRRSGAQTDFLRMFVAKLIDLHFDIELAGAQVAAARTAQLLLKVRPTPKTVSLVWTDARRDRFAFPPAMIFLSEA